jgi:uncharacterized protein involved in type VI secretion and phage assembly
MPSFSQADRQIQVNTALGEKMLLATGFRGREELNELFSFELDCVAENSTEIDFSKLIGTEVTLKIATPGKGTDQEWRYVSVHLMNAPLLPTDKEGRTCQNPADAANGCK